MRQYHQAVQAVQTSLQDRTRRVLAVLVPDLPATAVEQVIESGQTELVIERAMISDDLDTIVRVPLTHDTTIVSFGV